MSLSDKLEAILAVVQNMDAHVGEISESMKTLELKIDFLGKQVTSHDVKIERLIEDLAKLETRVDAFVDKGEINRENEKERGRMAEWWFHSVEYISQFLHALPQFWHLIGSIIFFLIGIWEMFKDHVKHAIEK